MEWPSIQAVNWNKTVVQQDWINVVQQNWNVLKEKAAFAVIPWMSCDLVTEVNKKLSHQYYFFFKFIIIFLPAVVLIPGVKIKN